MHDPDADDPKLLMATVTDVEPAWPRVNPASLDDAARWTATRAGLPTVTLVPVVGARCWRVDEGESR